MKKIFIVILVLLSIISCSSSDNEDSIYLNTEIINTEEYQKIKTSNNDFAFDIFNTIVSNSSGENVFISPVSLTFALSMAYNGAVGDTADDMAEAMYIKDIDLDKLNQSMLYLKHSITNTKDTKISIANSLWGNKEIEFKEDFFDTLKNYYKAFVKSLDFSDSSTSTEEINKWVEDNTGGMIKKLIDRTKANAIMYLLNAIYFKGSWSEKFEKDLTMEKPFYKADGKETKTDMMHKYGSEFRYTNTDDGYQLLRLPYGEKERFGMTFILPSETKTVNDFLSEYNSEKFKTLMESMYKTTIDSIVLPKFKIEYKRTLVEDLKQLGMSLPFVSPGADFSKIADRKDIIISEIIQKAVIELNEAGTEASAATGIVFETTSAEPSPATDFIADHPFLFILDDSETNTILFMGVYHDPTTAMFPE